ncbi:MAG: GNAT family N-acetyltransferase [candidate division WOR-3 bacterium]
MKEIIIKDVTEENIEEFCWFCVAPNKRNDPDWQKGVEYKRQWAEAMLKKWGPFAKLAYHNNCPVGMIQYQPIPEQRIVYIDCIWVPLENYWQKGIATQLLAKLLEDIKNFAITGLKNKSVLALVTKTFPGGAPNQLTAQQFFTKKGFQPIGKDPNYLYYPLKPGFVYRPKRKKAIKYKPQKEDKGKVLIVCGPNPCPATYPYFLKRMEKYIGEIDAKIPIEWLDTAQDSEAVKKRKVNIGDCIVNAKLIKAFVLDKAGFQNEVKKALQ